MNAPKSVEYTRDQLVELFTEHASDGWSGDAAALSPEQAADAILALSGPVSGVDTSSVAGVHSSQEGSDHQGLTPLEKELLERLHWAVTCADRLAATTPAGFLRRGIKLGAEECRAAIAKAEATATEAQHAGQWRPIESAPRDGTPILAWTVHSNAKYAKDPIAERWACATIIQWIDHNGGGWTWHGLAGEHTHWQPLLAPPPTDAEGHQP